MKFSSIWFQGLTAKEKEEMQNLLEGNTILLDKLQKIVYNMSIEQENVSTPDYDTPSWSHKQAHVNGFKHFSRKLLEIITPKDRD